MTLYIFDTDHLSLYERSHSTILQQIQRHLKNNSVRLTVTVVTVEEQLAGRLAQLRKATTPERITESYHWLKATILLFQELNLLEYTLDAEDTFRKFRQQGIRIGTMDLRIASIAIVNDGILLTRNRQDFEKAPGLKIEDWSV